MTNTFNFHEAEDKLKVKFKNKELLEMAFTHSSYANENNKQSNERLEFLGDSVLGLIVTQVIYSKTDFKEGQLSKLRALLVSEEPLSRIVDMLDIEKLMLKGKGESKSKVSSKAIKCDLFEAIVGAIYSDLGFGAAKKFVLFNLKPIFEEVSGLETFEDAKTQLQEKFAHKKIFYKTKKIGLEHNPEYESVVYINGVACGKGNATNKRSAEQLAAQVALRSVTKV